MPPPPVLPARPVAALGGLLLVAGVAWAAVMPTQRTLICSERASYISDAGLLGDWRDLIGVQGVRVTSAGGGALGGATGWLAVAETHEGDLMLTWEPLPTKAEAEARVAPLAAWLAGGRHGQVTIRADRGPAAYGLPGTVAGLGLALLLLAAVVGSSTRTMAVAPEPRDRHV